MFEETGSNKVNFQEVYYFKEYPNKFGTIFQTFRTTNYLNIVLLKQHSLELSCPMIEGLFTLRIIF